MLARSKKRIKRYLTDRKYKNRIRYEGPIDIHPHVDLNQVTFGRHCLVAHHAEIANARIGNRTSIGRYAKIQTAQIGNFCSISWGTTIGATSHTANHISTHAFRYRKVFGLVEEDQHFEKSPVEIGHDVWIGCDVVVMPGIKVGNGAVIGAGTIVTKDVPAYSVVVGNPGRVIKYRFEEAIRHRLDQTQWWDLPDDQLKELMPLFDQPLTSSVMDEFEYKLRSLWWIKNIM